MPRWVLKSAGGHREEDTWLSTPRGGSTWPGFIASVSVVPALAPDLLCLPQNQAMPLGAEHTSSGNQQWLHRGQAPLDTATLCKWPSWEQQPTLHHTCGSESSPQNWAVDVSENWDKKADFYLSLWQKFLGTFNLAMKLRAVWPRDCWLKITYHASAAGQVESWQGACWIDSLFPHEFQAPLVKGQEFWRSGTDHTGSDPTPPKGRSCPVTVTLEPSAQHAAGVPHVPVKWMRIFAEAASNPRHHRKVRITWT